jgi:hypothetical protein
MRRIHLRFERRSSDFPVTTTAPTTQPDKTGTRDIDRDWLRIPSLAATPFSANHLFIGPM